MANCINGLAFMSQFPEFNNTDSGLIEILLNRALCFIKVYCNAMCECRELAIFLLTAHLLTLQGNIANGDATGGLQASATIDKVSVSNVPPPTSDSFGYWLNQTTYGQQLLALIELNVPTPMYFGGSDVRVLK